LKLLVEEQRSAINRNNWQHLKPAAIMRGARPTLDAKKSKVQTHRYYKMVTCMETGKPQTFADQRR
jgi:hypothetical protein